MESLPLEQKNEKLMKNSPVGQPQGHSACYQPQATDTYLMGGHPYPSS